LPVGSGGLDLLQQDLDLRVPSVHYLASPAEAWVVERSNGAQ
jgi:hypothetical protein